MPWGDKATSPCIWTPMSDDAGGMEITGGLSIEDGKLGKATTYLYHRIVFTTRSSLGAGSNDVIGNIRFYDLSDNIISPVGMTGYTMDGITVSTTISEYNPVWRAFCTDNGAIPLHPSNYFQTISPGTLSIKVAYPVAKSFGKVRLFPNSGQQGYMPRAFRIEVSNTGAFSGEEIVKITSGSFDWTDDQPRYWSVS